jgi:HEAT repeat protein
VEDVIDSPMYKDPDIPVSREVVTYSNKSIPLWLKALDRPQADLKRRVADTIVLAHRHGVKGLEKTIAPLRATLDQREQHPAVRLAVARALIVLDVRAATESLWKHAQDDGGDLRDLVEPVLARWGHRPARAVWLSRLRDPAARPRDLVLAISCLETLREEQAVEPLRELVLAVRTAAPVRLQAARVLGSLRRSGLEKEAKSLASDTSTRGLTSRLAAAALLRFHQSQEAIALLQRLSGDREPAVTGAAAAPLVERDAKLLLALLDHLLGSRDARVRLLGVEALFRLPDDKHIRLLGARLDDFDPDVRVQARRSLRALGAKKEHRQVVLDVATAALGRDSWREQEQSAILLAHLDHKPAARRLVELLTAPRREVFVSSAWALRKLAVRETLPPVLEHVAAELPRQLDGKNLPDRGNAGPWVDVQLSQLNQFLGQQRYAPADSVLRKFVPKPQNSVLAEARAAAIWALGKIHEGKNDSNLANALIGRLMEIRAIPPEQPQVRYMSAITLARMKSEEALASIRSFMQGGTLSADRGSNVFSWAVMQLTGEKMPAPRTIHREVSGWFLTVRE